MQENYNLSGELVKAMERAIYVAEDLASDELCTCHVVLGILMNYDCCIQSQFREIDGIVISPKRIIYDLLNSKELYKEVFGKDFTNYNDEIKETKNNIESEDNVEESQQKIVYNINISNVDNYIDNYFDYDNAIYSQNLTAAFEDAYKRCSSNGNEIIDEENLLFSILNMEANTAIKIFENFEFDVSELKNLLVCNANIYDMLEDNKLKIPIGIENCCEVLNDKYIKGETCEILGRDKEISSVWNIFSKKTKRNAILVGKAGVGKTAIVEAITMQIVNDTCPREFKNYNVVSLDLNNMVAGTKYRGEFEQKVQNFIKFLKSTKNIIVFVDEIHQILGAGSTENSGPDLSGSLKPILARDDVVFIGSTTTIEYERYFVKDPAFKRRFEMVEVKEPSLKDVKSMVKLKVRNISKYHGVKISDEVLNYCIITAKAMNYTSSNPDLTIDLVDRAMAVAKIARSKELKRSDVDKVYKQNYDNFKCIKKKDKLSTAYHEAGHALLKLLAKYDTRKDLKIVSIIPTAEYLGVTITEENSKYTPMTRKAVHEQAAMCLAGRVAQEFVDKNWDFGASSDLEQATGIIRKMIIEMGMDNNIYTNISLYDYDSNTHTMSPEAIDKVNERIKEIMKEVYDNTKALLEKNKDKLDIIAELLMEKGIISVEEIKEAFKKLNKINLLIKSIDVIKKHQYFFVYTKYIDFKYYHINI